jgi:hypothetical protein
MLSYQMTKAQKIQRENALHPVGENFLVQCVGYRGLAHRNSIGQWKSIFGNKTLPKNISFIPPMQSNVQALPDGQPVSPMVPAVGPVPDGPGRN